ncbi:MAG: hypothetical protein JW947_10990, partial [Sedimentisphaerales bacterium]|nr:hypothetical protein [Sedimentisphaerales bacterium]
TDLDGRDRFADGDCNTTVIVDMGAYEYPSPLLYVDAGATGANDGSSWTDAYNYLQDALTVAESNNIIWVAQGTYKPDANNLYPSGIGDRTATFQLKNNVSIYGGFPTGGGSRDPNTYVTSLSGDINVADNNSDNSYHVVTGSSTNSTAVLNGFIITKGYADAGGGMYNFSGSPTVTNCTLSGNSADYYGGGMFNNSSSPTLTNCIFSDNSSTNDGGGMLNDFSSPTVTRCTFAGNSADSHGGGMFNLNNSSPTLTNCMFSGNSAPNGGGGGMYNSSSPALMTGCTFSGNSAGFGGGMLNNSSSPTITGCSFSENSASHGGGMCNFSGGPKITNCTFSENSADYHGGGMSNFSCGPEITNCTFSGNSAGSNGGGMFNSSGSPTVVNCILWGNTAPNGPQIYGSSTVSFSDVQGGWTGLGNIDADPRFVDADANDYHLQSEGWSWDIQRKVWTWDDVTSRCIDAGNPGSSLSDEPLSVPQDPNNEWGHNLRIDMGVYGGTAEASIPPYDWVLLADLTNDGLVSLTDYAYQAADWLNSADNQPGDLNRDGLIDTNDLALLTEDWLAQTSWY